MTTGPSVSSKDGATNDEAAESMTEAKFSVSDEVKLPSNSKNVKVTAPKSVMVLEISDVAEFSKIIEIECYSNFIVDIVGVWVKIITDS